MKARSESAFIWQIVDPDFDKVNTVNRLPEIRLRRHAWEVRIRLAVGGDLGRGVVILLSFSELPAVWIPQI